MSNDAVPAHGIALVPQQTAPQTASGGGENVELSWAQPPGMVALSFKNFLYRIITLGIYHFWGKTEVRKRIWSAIRINGEPLQYTGTGKEMFLGFVFVLVVLTVPTLLLVLVGLVVAGETGANVVQTLVSIAFFYLVGVGMHRAIRYRMSRTLWRGIRGGLEGDSWGYGWTYFWTGIVLVLTLGWAGPWRAVKLQGLVSNGLRFGDRPFRFAASAGPLYGPFAVLWISALGILGLVGAALFTIWKYLALLGQMSRPGQPMDPGIVFGLVALLYGVFIAGFLLFAVVSAWYRARLMNHFAAHTSFEGVRFSGSATGRSLIWLAVSNTLMVIFTLGLLAPVAQARSARYFVQRLKMEGVAPLDQILQGAHHEGRGEGLAQAFDIDAF
jgi:uncharacterized membrane protein YjgN (DUF898 family)